eukprot:GHUV01034938.1.p1 GENE.GHUV01034938.1~~GHUV01034938.1.p1  ORF type:complete len:292 (+),score=28.25 GHUV01034938.1:485-1360(+)
MLLLGMTCCMRQLTMAEVWSLLSALLVSIRRMLLLCVQVFSNARQNFHITVFHFSHPADPRPDALDPHSGLGQLLLQDSPDCQARIEDEGDLGKLGKLADLSAGVTKQASTTACPPRVAATCSSIEPVLPVPYNRPGPTQQQIQAEQRAMASVTSNTTPFTLQVDRVLLAPSGVLLLTWVDPSGSLGRLRQSLHEAFPGACSRQSSIIHTSLFRIVDVPTTVTEGSVSLESQNAVACLDQSTINNIQATCSKWTSRVHGMKMIVDRVWWAEEHEFSSIEGLRVPMSFKKAE